MSKKRKSLLFIALVAMFVLVSSLDHQDEQMQQRFFCEQVKAGVWPNYKGIRCGGNYNG